MTIHDAGGNASSARDGVRSEPLLLSPAARKFAEYLARRMVPMIESAATKRTEAMQQANGAVALYTERRGD